jgi:hypothetical protein
MKLEVMYNLNVLLLLEIYWYTVPDCNWNLERTGWFSYMEEEM